MTGGTDGLFDVPEQPAPAVERSEREDGPRWVVEIDEVLLRAVASPGLEWWAVQQMAPFEAWQRRLHIIAITVPGAIFYLDCDSEQEGAEFREWAIEKGCHPKAVQVRRIGHLITCKGCGERRPFWATGRRIGSRCRPCYEEATALPWPGGSTDADKTGAA